MTNKMIILRGVSGSGKSTFAKMFKEETESLFDEVVICSADNYFTNKDGQYNFDPSKLPEAHAQCYKTALQSCMDDDRFVIIDNTNTCRWEFQPYLDMAKEYEYEVTVLHVNGNFDNIHNVPDEVIAKQRKRFEHNWEEAEMLAPWNR